MFAKRNSVTKPNGSAPSAGAKAIPESTEPVTPLGLTSLVPRDLITKGTTATEATIQYLLPPTCTSLGGAVDVRVLIRPSKLFKEADATDRRLNAQIGRLRMESNMEFARMAGKPGWNQHESFLELNRKVSPLQQEAQEVWEIYRTKCRELLSMGEFKEGEANEYPIEGWYIVNGPDFSSFRALRGFSKPEPVSVSASPETNTITIKNLASNVFYEVAMAAKRAGKTTDDEGEENRIWSPLSATIGFSTKTAPWQLALEKIGLRHLIEPFTNKGLDSFASWLDISQDIKEELGIDAAADQLIAEVLSANGIVTPAEQARIDRERAEMVGVVNTLLNELRGQEGAFGTGDPVTEKVVINKRRGARFGVVVSVTGDTCSVRWEDPRTKDPANSVTEDNVKTSSLIRSNFTLFMSHAQADAQNQVAHLSVLLRDRDAKIWFDMDSERLEARDMVRGISNSKVFLLYLTKSYFDRWFCRLEASVARALNKPLVIVYEPDERHGGKADYVSLVSQCTQKFPEFKEFLLTTEAIPMARRAFQRRAVVDEICKRAGLQSRAGSFTEKEGGGGLLSSFAGPTSSSSSSGGAAGTLMELSDLRQMILDLKMEMNDLKAENRELRQMVEQLVSDHTEG